MVEENMDDSFNTTRTIASLFEMATLINSIKGGQVNKSDINQSSILLLQKTMQDYLIMFLVCKKM